VDPKKKLSLKAYQLAELNDRYQQIGLLYSTDLHDYGTGELYTSTEVHMVTRIEDNPGITAVKIAEDTARTKSAVSQMLSKLETKGLIYREQDPDNRRQHLLFVTEKGRELSRCHKEYDEQSMPLDDVIAKFGIEAVENFADILEYSYEFMLKKRQEK